MLSGECGDGVGGGGVTSGGDGVDLLGEVEESCASSVSIVSRSSMNVSLLLFFCLQYINIWTPYFSGIGTEREALMQLGVADC